MPPLYTIIEDESYSLIIRVDTSTALSRKKEMKKFVRYTPCLFNKEEAEEILQNLNTLGESFLEEELVFAQRAIHLKPSTIIDLFSTISVSKEA